jgi:hypothetical protein
VEPVNVLAVLALGVAPPNGPQEVDGPLNQVNHQELEDAPLPAAQPVGQINHVFNNVEMNYMFAQDWQLDPVFQMHMERKRTTEFYKLWAIFFAPVGKPEISVKIPKKWSSFFLSNLLQPDSFNWSKSFLSYEIPPTLLEPELEALSFAIPKSYPNDKFLDNVLSEGPQGRISNLEDVDSSPSRPTIVDSDLRRIKRLREFKASFKQGSC